MNKFKIIFLIVLIALIGFLYYGNTVIKTRIIKIEKDKIPKEFSGFKLAHVSDYHNKNWKGKLIAKLKEASPDIIVITGDMIDARRTNIPLAVDFIKKAISIAPVYYANGNHEGRIPDYPKFREEIKELGVVVLEDESVFIEKENSKILLMGAQDPTFTPKNSNLNSNDKVLENSIKNMDKDFDGYKILLSHRPELFKTYAKMKVDLALAGHAHGGQFILPFIGPIFAPSQGFFPKYTSGLYSIDNYDLIVSRGLGNSLIPIRFNNNPDLIIVELKNKQ